MTAVGQVRGGPDFVQFLELLVEYERSLPVALRHGRTPDLALVRKEYCEPNAAFIALVNDAASGCVAVTRQDDATAIVKRLYVRPAFRNCGVARALVAAVIEYCREGDCERVVLDTERESLPAAHRLYASLGFRECEPYGTVQYNNPTFMELRLSR